MRIVFVHPAFLGRGGAENLTVWLASGLAARGHDVTLAAAGIDRDKWPELDERVASLELPDRNDELVHEPRRRRRHGPLLAPHCRHADVVVAGNFPAYWWVADGVARLEPSARPATVLFCHEPPRRFYFLITDRPIADYLRSGRRTLPFHDDVAGAFSHRMRRFRLSRVPVARWLDRRAVRRIDRIVTNSDYTRASVLRAWGREAETCGAGVPDPGAVPIVPYQARDGVAVLTGFSLVKNPMGVLGTIAEVVRRLGRDDIRFTLTGQGLRPHHEQYLRDLGLRGTVTLPGYVTESEKVELLGRSRLCLFIPLAEPLGLVMIESMLLGTPVVGSDHGGPAEVIRDGTTGRLADPFDPAAVARAVVELYDDRERWEVLSRNGRALARERFLLPAFVDRFEAVARRAVQARAGGGGGAG